MVNRLFDRGAALLCSLVDSVLSVRYGACEGILKGKYQQGMRVVSPRVVVQLMPTIPTEPMWAVRARYRGLKGARAGNFRLHTAI